MEMSGWMLASLGSKKIFGKDGGAEIVVRDSRTFRDLRDLESFCFELPIDNFFFLHQYP
jgi:hypothetical protein